MMDRSEFLNRVRSRRTAWDALAGRVEPARMTVSGVEGEWSLKDVIAHITWYESEMVALLRARALVGSPLWNLTTEERNQEIYAQIKDCPLTEVTAAAQQVHAALLAELEKLSDEDLNDPSHFSDWPPDWIPWELLASNTFDHYDEHLAALQAWLG